MGDAGWSDANSETFFRLGDVLVPDRETQLHAMCAPVPESPGLIVEQFEIADGRWRSEWQGTCDAVVSSLAVHHLDDPGTPRLLRGRAAHAATGRSAGRA